MRSVADMGWEADPQVGGWQPEPRQLRREWRGGRREWMGMDLNTKWEVVPIGLVRDKMGW